MGKYRMWKKIILYKKSNRNIRKIWNKKRAKEVLQEIIKEYTSYLELRDGPAIMQGHMDIQPNVFNIPKVYEMPKE